MKRRARQWEEIASIKGHLAENLKLSPCKAGGEGEGHTQPCNTVLPLSLPQVNSNIRLTGSWGSCSRVVLSKLWVAKEKIREHN